NPRTLLSNATDGYQRYWFRAWGLLPRWQHRPEQPADLKPEGLSELKLTWYSDHIEHRGIARLLEPMLAAQGVRLITQEVDYESWYHGATKSDLWLGSVNFTLPLAFSVFALLHELPLLHHCIDIDWENDAGRWRQQTLPLAEWCKKLIDNHYLHPLFHHWLLLEGQRSMRGVRMNTLGWFDFKSAWFAPPET
ncbi:MAG: transcriptional regulator SgrR, partial [Pantoea sp.]|nr:transcriptional regulator SgrR [Pantoea sp.]